ncbi:hypothetical protein WMY93_016098 [Mugilogobius chulae]|uniref:Uncharacterized protein n=1 Tax=Mugilogobius chulae TaxID=88201 RepID=A0AAW0P249_9GOBI
MELQSIKEVAGVNSVVIKHEVKLVLPDNTTEQTDVKCDLYNSKSEVTKAMSKSSLFSVEKEQPKPLYTLLPPACCTIQHPHETIKMKSQDSLKTATEHSIPPDETGSCAAVLLACLFCQPLNCLLATVGGCRECMCWLCSSLCGCGPTVLQPLQDMSHQCELCACLGARCSLCDCPFCDICLQATECLDLAMEISQMLYH